MGASRKPAGADMIVSGVESITDIGGGRIRVVYYVNRIDVDGTLERMPIETTLVMPINTVADAIGKAMLAIGRHIFTFRDGSLTIMH